MTKVALSLLLVSSLYFLAAPASWAQQKPAPAPEAQAPKLYQQCQDQSKKDPKNETGKSLCEKGMKLYQEGKQEEAIKTIQEGLATFK